MGAFLSKLDVGYFRVEKAIVVGALAVMSITVFLDVVHRRLVAPDSAITRLLLLPKRANLRRQHQQSIGGRAKSEAQFTMEIEEKLAHSRDWLNHHVSPLILGLLIFILVLAAVHTATRTRRSDKDKDKDNAQARDGPAALPRWAYLAALGGCVATSAIVVNLPPGGRWPILLALAAGGAALSRFAGRARLLVLAGAITAGLALVAWLMLNVHSRWTYVLLVVISTGGIVLRPAVRAKPRLIAASLGGGFVIVVLACLRVPDGFAWAKEVAMQLLLWVGFFGASMAAHSRQHIMVDFVRKNVPERYRKYYEGLSALIAAGFCMLLTYLAYLYVFGAPAPMSIYSMDAELDYTGLPSWIGVAAIPLGLATTSLRFLGISFRAFTGKLETNDGAGQPVVTRSDADSPNNHADTRDKDVNKDAEKDVNKDAEKGADIAAEKDVNKDADKGADIAAEKDVNKDAEKDVNKDAEKGADIAAEKDAGKGADKEADKEERDR